MSNEDLIMSEQERVAEDVDVLETVHATSADDKTDDHVYALIDEATEVISANNLNREPSLRVSQSINDVMIFYKELYREKMLRKQHTAPDAFLVTSTKLHPPPPHCHYHPKHDSPTSLMSKTYVFLCIYYYLW
ncbi:putative Tigger transposable element-derived protein 1-like 269 [Homarus americanus]|uniref:Putative Tigger transposable element-derived protein 1-like 269 n=1 Tax=Homarus americanus TaxID=6706 RepID=A0A8J5T956_HOMAM|nr:putative Tigger transposable element-derived protein 1-like 269 [Homarus americanus]